MSETPLLGMLMESEKDKPPLIQVPTLAKPSMYHKVCNKKHRSYNYFEGVYLEEIVNCM